MKAYSMKTIITSTVAAILCAAMIPVGITGHGVLSCGCVSAEELFEVDIDKLRDDLDRYIAQAESNIRANKIREARQAISLVEQKVAMHKKKLSRMERDVYNGRISTISAALEAQIDSLVAKNLDILRRQGASAAIEYRQLLTRCGVSEAELVAVDEAIVSSGPVIEESRERPAPRAPPDAERQQRREELMREEQARLEKERAELVRRDSIRAESLRRDSIRLEHARQESLKAEEERQKKAAAEQSRIEREKAAVERAERERAARALQDSIKQQQARLAQIEAEQARINKMQQETARQWKTEEARRDRTPAAQQQCSDSIAAAQMRVDRSIAEQTSKLQRLEERDANIERARQTVARIEQLAAANKIDEANTLFNIYEPNLRRYLDQGVYERLKSTISGQYAAYQRMHRWAVHISDSIMALVEQKKGAEAHDALTRSRADLQKYLAAAVFEEMERKVTEEFEHSTRQRIKAMSAAAKIGELLDEKKIEQAHDYFQRSRGDLALYLDKAVFVELDRTVGEAYSAMQNKKAWAEQYARDTRRMIKENRGAEAQAYFEKNKAALGQYLDSESFASLQTDVTTAYGEYRRRRENARAIMKSIEEMLGAKNADKAYAEFAKNSQVLRSDLDDAAAYDALREKVNAAYAELKQRQEQAAQFAKSVAVLIEQKEGVQAYERWQQGRGAHRDYLSAQAYDSLERTVNAARDDFVRNQTKAQVTVTTITTMLMQKKVEDAYAMFQKEKRFLEHYLADDKMFTGLAAQVSDAYKALMERRRMAEQRLREIHALIAQREGVRAYELYVKEKELLAEYGDAGTVKTTAAAAQKARSEYVANQEKARAASAGIYKQLEQSKVDQAFIAFQAQKDTIRHYLDDDEAFGSLKTAVEQAYRGLLAKRKWAVQLERQIRAMARKGDGLQAKALYDKNMADLQRFLDVETFKTLDVTVTQAVNDYTEGAAWAKQNAARIQTLLEQKDIKEAYAVYDENEEDLKKYLPPKTFEGLQAQVERHYDVLQEKERLALAEVRKIHLLIKQQKGNEAAAAFEAEKAALKAYLEAETFASLAERVAQANAEYAKNKRRSASAAAAIHDLAAKGRIEEAYSQWRSARSELKMYLDNAEYARLETAVMKSYETFSLHRKNARAEAAAISRLLNKSEVVAAYNAFYKMRATLKTYLPTDEFTELSSAVSAAYGDYVKNNMKARDMAEKIYDRVDERTIDAAYAQLKNNRPFLKQYLAKEAYEKLDETITELYRKIEAERKAARAYEKQIYSLLGKGDLWPAYRNFRSKRTWLKRYLDTAAFEALESKVLITYTNARKKK